MERSIDDTTVEFQVELGKEEEQKGFVMSPGMDDYGESSVMESSRSESGLRPEAATEDLCRTYARATGAGFVIGSSTRSGNCFRTPWKFRYTFVSKESTTDVRKAAILDVL